MCYGTVATIRFRPFHADDFAILLDWLQRRQVKERWDDGDDTIAKVARHYTSDKRRTKRFVATLDGRDAGYFQYCRIDGARSEARDARQGDPPSRP